MKMLRSIVERGNEKPVFQLFFLKNDEHQGVEVVEVEKIDFTKVKESLERGESVFITRKCKPKLDPTKADSKNVTEPCAARAHGIFTAFE